MLHSFNQHVFLHAHEKRLHKFDGLIIIIKKIQGQNVSKLNITSRTDIT